LFTGTLEGRVIEILQNARRAGATKVEINNQDGHVTVRDDGRGIEDFAKLLDLGGSGWEDSLEASEDPAGVGIFCLAPREVTIRSNGQVATISGKGWTGAPVAIHDDPEPVQGTVLRFQDEAWTPAAVDRNAVFCGMDVTVDGEPCPKRAFLSDQATPHPELGCRIEVRETETLDSWHCSCNRSPYHSRNALVNFHGQVVAFDCHPVSEHHLHFLVDMTGEPTGIRLMLPARTCLVENEAFRDLKDALEREAFRYLQRRGHHSLPYKEYLRAKKLGINLPEAEPTFTVGLIGHGDPPEPVEVVKPKRFPLAKCYRFDLDSEDGHETDEANVHLLAALGTFEQPFVPVDIHQKYDGYSWARLPRIGKVEVKLGEARFKQWIWSGELICVDSITITAHASDGRVFSSEVCMALLPPEDSEHLGSEDRVYVTPDAQERLSASEIWHHFGGWYDEGDTYDTQAHQFQQELEQFWMQLIGPDEQLRRSIVGPLESLQPDWKAVTVAPEGTVTLRFIDGTSKALRPPVAESPA
jgi:hypothetical protein